MRDLDCKQDTYGVDCDYDELVNSFEVETLLEVSDNNYQGDTRYLLRDGDRYGILIFGWGSCSGCDALQACTTVADAVELRDELWESVHWEPDLSAMSRYVHDKDWSLDYSYHASATREFIEAVKKLLAVDGTPNDSIAGGDR